MTPVQFGRYTVQEEIGDGAMGRVYRCLDPLMRRAVAIKTIKSEYLTRDTAEEYLRRFRREAQAAGRLSHPNIVSIFDVDESWFVMEYLEGVTLQKLLAERVRIPLEEVLALLAPLGDALDYAHRSGIVHRDIKPANVMVLPDGRPKLMDFGVARLESSVATAAGHFFGSPSYMAPEQIAGGEVSAKADLFAFAIVAYEAITGRRPFEGDSITSVMYRVVNEDPPPPRQWDFDLPPVYDEIFRRALHKVPAERYPDAMSLVGALQLKDVDAMLAALPDTPPAAPRAAEAPAGEKGGGGGRTGAGARVTAATVSDPRMISMETHALVEGPDELPLARAAERTTPPALVHRSRWPLAAALLAALAVGASVATLARREAAREDEPPATAATAPSAPEPFRIEAEPQGARVWLDDVSVGEAPVALPDVAPGRHKVRVALDGYAPAEVTLDLTAAGMDPPPLRFALEPVTATLTVTSEPEGAAVRIDGRRMGVTPLGPLVVAPGIHDVRLEKKGFLTSSQRVEGKAGESLRVAGRLLPEPEGSAAVRAARTAPPGWVAEGALVEVDSAVRPPRKISGDSPPYPESARRLNLLGTVKVSMIVDETGGVSSVRVVESAGAVLDRAVIEAVQGWRYAPATRNGVKVKVRWSHRHRFVAARS